ncbi:hypothetical protein Tco_1124068 [Tanacetum coccineum]|uniref:Transposase Tnp1/En/Spm-like domain-containing protein n=1 Tax=Tanacetum coccineum TaxID=301880 RepID=A0ABQ5J846_9ASTR
MAAPGGANQIARRVIDDLIEFSGETSVDGYMSFFKSQQIAESRGFINRMREEANTVRNLVGQLNALIAEMEALEDQGELFDTLMDLRDDREAAQTKLQGLNELITQAEQEIETKEAQIQAMNGQKCFALDTVWFHFEHITGIMETEANDLDHLVNYDNDNDIDDLGYESEVYLDEEEDENNHSNGNVVKRGITRLSKFHREYGKPNGIKLSVTFDALNRISGSHRALFLSFLGDLVREHIGLKILSWKKVGSEARDKLWDEITRYFDVDLTVRKLVMNHLGQLLRNFRRKLRQTYILPNQNTLSKLNEVPAKYSAILKAKEWVNFVKYTTTKEYQVKSAATKMAHSKSVYQHTMGRGGYAHVKQKMTDGKQILHNKELPKDCYKVSVDKSLVDATCIQDVGNNSCKIVKDAVVDAACIPDVGNNGFKTVKDAVGGIFAWPKDQVVLDPKPNPLCVLVTEEIMYALLKEMREIHTLINNDLKVLTAVVEDIARVFHPDINEE